MDSSRERMEWAYLDGELSASEAAEFDRSLTDEEREHLATEMRIEAHLAEHLSQRVVCPDHVWRNSLAQVKKVRRSQSRHFWRRFAFGMVSLAAAASLIVVFAFHWGSASPSATPRFLLLPEGDVSALAAHAQVSDGLSNVRNFLNQRAVQISFDPGNLLDSQEAPYLLLGACENDYNDEPIVELLFACGDYPAKVIIVPQSGPAAFEVGKAIANGQVRASRPVGNVLIAVVGEHAPADLLNVVADPWVAVQPQQSEESPATDQPDGEPKPEETVSESSPKTPQVGDGITPPAPPKYFRSNPDGRPVLFT